MMEYEILNLKFTVSIWGIECLIFLIIVIVNVIIWVLKCLKFVWLSLSTSQDFSEEPLRKYIWGCSFIQTFFQSVLLAVAWLLAQTEKALLGVALFLLSLMTLLPLHCGNNFAVNSYNKEIWWLVTFFYVFSSSSCIPLMFHQSHKLCCARLLRQPRFHNQWPGSMRGAPWLGAIYP